jgi:hypothetical protein
MHRRHRSAFAVTLLTLAALPAHAAEVLVSTITASPTRMSSHQAGWGPQVRFGLLGPVADESTVTLTCKKDGKVFATMDRKLGELGEGEVKWVDFSMLEDEQQIKGPATVGFEISLTPPGGAAQKLFEGKMVASKNGDRQGHSMRITRVTTMLRT